MDHEQSLLFDEIPRASQKKSLKKKKKKKGKLMLAYLAEIALGARSTKNCSTRKVQEPFA